MNPILFKVLLMLSIPAQDVDRLKEFADRHDITVEHMLEVHIAEILMLGGNYIEVEKIEEEKE